MEKRPAVLAQVSDHGVVLVVIGADVVPVEDEHAVGQALSELPLGFPPTRSIPRRRVDALARTGCREVRRGHRDRHIVEPGGDRVTELVGLSL